MNFFSKPSFGSHTVMLCTMNYTRIGLLNPVEEKYEVMRPESVPVFLWRRVTWYHYGYLVS